MMKRLWWGVLFVMVVFLPACAAKQEEKYETVRVTTGSIQASIPGSGVVEPCNRLEIKPPIAGRVDRVRVVEGEHVKAGQVLAWMSSVERAALLDAARAKGEAEREHWEEIYRPAPLLAPLSGFIISRNVEPGQSVTVNDPLLVMADRLIVKAQVDETDLGGIFLGQKVTVILDAYPKERLAARVAHIAYESKTVNNVNVYEVDVVPVTVPSHFRAGMSATVQFKQQEKEGILVLPVNAVRRRGGAAYVFIPEKEGEQPKPRQISVGLENTTHVEIVSGLRAGDEVVIPTPALVRDALQRGRGGPFRLDPFGRERRS